LDAAQHQRFSRCYRLTGPADYQRVFKKARRLSSPGFTILIRANECGYPRLGLIVSRKSARKAVQRNIIKRLIRESFRQQRPCLGNYDIVVMAKPTLTARTNLEIRNLLVQHWIDIE
jgi:ribonuclease P protein component